METCMNLKHIAIGVASLSLLAACSSTKPAPVAQQPATSAPVVNGGASTGAAGSNVVDPLKDPNSPLSKRSVYFDYDSSVVKSDYKSLLDAHSAYLKDHTNRHVQIQGNTDARGSREYNLGLGQRRAEAVKKSLEVLGVKNAQIEAISYGKERPRATGTTEADYAENRRADISYDGE
jgi:peptidoglycan-associated lipoprotein